jgi:glycosyltransferase involved in cell wall biosynthesis
MLVQEGVSIIICSYNGASRLEEVLTAIALLDRKHVPFVELIFADNASTDNSTLVVQQKWEQLNTPFPLILLKEAQPGKIFALQKALKEANASVVLICDDDNILTSNFLNIGFDLLKNNPEVGVIGSNGIPKSKIDIPNWFHEVRYNYACGAQAPQSGDVSPTRNVVYGAGMFFRKEAYETALSNGFKFLAQNREGSSLKGGGEDGELCWAIKMQGYEIWYEDRLKFYHIIPEIRLSKEYYKKLLIGGQVNGPLSSIHLRIWSGKIANPVSLFWQKELIYYSLDFIKKIVLFPIHRDKKELFRIYFNIIYLLIKRSFYDKCINDILAYYNRVRN